METNNAPSGATPALQTLDQLHADHCRASARLRAPLWYRVGLALAVVFFTRAFAGSVRQGPR